MLMHVLSKHVLFIYVALTVILKFILTDQFEDVKDYKNYSWMAKMRSVEACNYNILCFWNRLKLETFYRCLNLYILYIFT